MHCIHYSTTFGMQGYFSMFQTNNCAGPANAPNVPANPVYRSFLVSNSVPVFINANAAPIPCHKPMQLNLLLHFYITA